MSSSGWSSETVSSSGWSLRLCHPVVDLLLRLCHPVVDLLRLCHLVVDPLRLCHPVIDPWNYQHRVLSPCPTPACCCGRNCETESRKISKSITVVSDITAKAVELRHKTFPKEPLPFANPYSTATECWILFLYELDNYNFVSLLLGRSLYKSGKNAIPCASVARLYVVPQLRMLFANTLCRVPSMAAISIVWFALLNPENQYIILPAEPVSEIDGHSKHSSCANTTTNLLVRLLSLFILQSILSLSLCGLISVSFAFCMWFSGLPEMVRRYKPFQNSAIRGVISAECLVFSASV